MPVVEQTFYRLAAIPQLDVARDVPLNEHTRFGIGGPAAILVRTASTEALIAASGVARGSGLPVEVIGGGTNLIVADEGFPGVVLRFTADRILNAGTRVQVDAGAELQSLVDFTIERGLKGLETLTRIPGSTGAAIYGNAGAYGHSIDERVVAVRYLNGARVDVLDRAGCKFRYRESIFKDCKDWIVLSVELAVDRADPVELRRAADGIREIRDAKYPPTMRCAGSIFKNLLAAGLPAQALAGAPPALVREGKAPAGWFLEQVGAKGMRVGGIRVADYHGNLVYNEAGGTARELCEVIVELKRRVRERFGFEMEEEVQYVGLSAR
ncbi:MAG: UDP-N-acetylmuramate dehydrogenase [Bryobacteraceae bacterium]